MDSENKNEHGDVSSAELTENYRCALPELSGDNLSLLLSSDAGRAYCVFLPRMFSAYKG